MKLNWGIIGTGYIAGEFTKGLGAAENCKAYSVASRTLEKAQEFAQKHGIERPYGSYQEMLEDPDVQAVYVAVPHSLHRDCTLQALEHGKPVLCEKPFALNSRQAWEMIDAARSEKLFVMEAMWTWFFPAMQKVRDLVAEGAIGEVRMIQADMGFIADRNPQGPLLNPEYGGGALLDVGVYTIAFAQMLMPKPDRVEGMATLGPTMVDEQASMILGYVDGAQAVLSCSLQTMPSHSAKVYGTKGVIEIDRFFWKPQKIRLITPAKGPREFDFPMKGNGYTYEAEHVSECITKGLIESPLMTWEKTREVLEIMDELRALWGVTYPGD